MSKNVLLNVEELLGVEEDSTGSDGSDLIIILANKQGRPHIINVPARKVNEDRVKQINISTAKQLGNPQVINNPISGLPQLEFSEDGISFALVHAVDSKDSQRITGIILDKKFVQDEKIIVTGSDVFENGDLNRHSLGSGGLYFWERKQFN